MPDDPPSPVHHPVALLRNGYPLLRQPEADDGHLPLGRVAAKGLSPDEEGLVEFDIPLQPRLVGPNVQRARQFVAVEGKPGLNPQGVARCQACRPQAQCRSVAEQDFPEERAQSGWTKISNPIRSPV